MGAAAGLPGQPGDQRAFAIIVSRVAPPAISPRAPANLSATAPFTFTDYHLANAPVQFYRVLLGP